MKRIWWVWLLTLRLSLGDEIAHQACSSVNYNCPLTRPCCSKYGYCGAKEHCTPELCVAGCTPPSPETIDNLAIDFSELPLLDDKAVFLKCINPKHVALTYDDGIHHKFTKKLLRRLRKRKIKATFFILGNSLADYLDQQSTQLNKHAKQNRKILRTMFSDGHDIASHSFDHSTFDNLNLDQIEFQLNTTSKLIAQEIGYEPKFFRPPEGALNRKALEKVKSLGYLVIYWNQDAFEFKSTRSAIIKTIKTIEPTPESGGHIILQHDILKKTIKIQDKIISILQKKGFEFVPLRVCIETRPYYVPESSV